MLSYFMMKFKLVLIKFCIILACNHSKTTKILCKNTALYVSGADPGIFNKGAQTFKKKSRRFWNRLFTPDKPRRFTCPAVFRRSDLMWNNTAFSWGVVKSSPRLGIWKYHYFKWGARAAPRQNWSFHIFIHNITCFQNLKRRICKVNLNFWKNRSKIQKLAKLFLPTPQEKPEHSHTVSPRLCKNKRRLAPWVSLSNSAPVYNCFIFLVLVCAMHVF